MIKMVLVGGRYRGLYKVITGSHEVGEAIPEEDFCAYSIDPVAALLIARLCRFSSQSRIFSGSGRRENQIETTVFLSFFLINNNGGGGSVVSFSVLHTKTNTL